MGRLKQLSTGSSDKTESSAVPPQAALLQAEREREHRNRDGDGASDTGASARYAAVTMVESGIGPDGPLPRLPPVPSAAAPVDLESSPKPPDAETALSQPPRPPVVAAVAAAPVSRTRICSSRRRRRGKMYENTSMPSRRGKKKAAEPPKHKPRDLSFIANRRKRKRIYRSRVKCLIKKARELSVLTDSEILLIVVDEDKQVTQLTSDTVNSALAGTRQTDVLAAVEGAMNAWGPLDQRHHQIAYPEYWTPGAADARRKAALAKEKGIADGVLVKKEEPSADADPLPRDPRHPPPPPPPAPPLPGMPQVAVRTRPSVRRSPLPVVCVDDATVKTVPPPPPPLPLPPPLPPLHADPGACPPPPPPPALAPLVPVREVVRTAHPTVTPPPVPHHPAAPAPAPAPVPAPSAAGIVQIEDMDEIDGAEDLVPPAPAPPLPDVIANVRYQDGNVLALEVEVEADDDDDDDASSIIDTSGILDDDAIEPDAFAPVHPPRPPAAFRRLQSRGPVHGVPYPPRSRPRPRPHARARPTSAAEAKTPAEVLVKNLRRVLADFEAATDEEEKEELKELLRKSFETVLADGALAEGTKGRGQQVDVEGDEGPATHAVLVKDMHLFKRATVALGLAKPSVLGRRHGGSPRRRQARRRRGPFGPIGPIFSVQPRNPPPTASYSLGTSIPPRHPTYYISFGRSPPPPPLPLAVVSSSATPQTGLSITVPPHPPPPPPSLPPVVAVPVPVPVPVGGVGVGVEIGTPGGVGGGRASIDPLFSPESFFSNLGRSTPPDVDYGLGSLRGSGSPESPIGFGFGPFDDSPRATELSNGEDDQLGSVRSRSRGNLMLPETFSPGDARDGDGGDLDF